METEEFVRRYSWLKHRESDLMNAYDELSKASYPNGCEDSYSPALRYAISQVVGSPRTYDEKVKSDLPMLVKKIVMMALGDELLYITKKLHEMDKEMQKG